jgi:nitrogen fixation protein NifZ
MRPRFDYGDEVRVLRNVRNDGTFPGVAVGTLLVRRGSVGYVRDLGTFLQDQIVYSVDFLNERRMVGCREEELQPAADPWVPSRFEFGDKVRSAKRLAIGGEVLVELGEAGEVMKVLRDDPGGVAYHVVFDRRGTLQVPESALTWVEPPADESPAETPVGTPVGNGTGEP